MSVKLPENPGYKLWNNININSAWLTIKKDPAGF